MYRFLERDGSWTFLPCDSDRSHSDALVDLLGDAGLRVSLDPARRLPEPLRQLPHRSAFAGPGTLRPVRHAPSVRLDTLRQVGEISPLGAVWSATIPDPSDGALVVPRVEGGAWLYQWSPSDTRITWSRPHPEVGDHTFRTSTADCTGGVARLTNVVGPLSDTDVEQVGALGDGTPVYRIIRVDHPVQQALIARYTSLTTAAAHERPEGLSVGLGPEALLATTPWVFVRDPFGRWVELERDDFTLPMFCEPIVYVYADPPREVRVSLGPDVRVTRSIPEPGPGGWQGQALPDGAMQIRGRRWPELFWEGTSVAFPPPAWGFVVAGADAPAALHAVLPALGLDPTETQAFVDAWAESLVGLPWVRLGFHDRSTIDRIAPLTIAPEPDAVIRVLMDVAPADGPATPVPPLPPVPSRTGGLVVVEWGGVRRVR
ncbi:MAG: hypothetical protein ABMB14_21050 [Myxococcota bacterium]